MSTLTFTAESAAAITNRSSNSGSTMAIGRAGSTGGGGDGHGDDDVDHDDDVMGTAEDRQSSSSGTADLPDPYCMPCRMFKNYKRHLVGIGTAKGQRLVTQRYEEILKTACKHLPDFITPDALHEAVHKVVKIVTFSVKLHADDAGVRLFR